MSTPSNWDGEDPRSEYSAAGVSSSPGTAASAAAGSLAQARSMSAASRQHARAVGARC